LLSTKTFSLIDFITYESFAPEAEGRVVEIMEDALSSPFVFIFVVNELLDLCSDQTAHGSPALRSDHARFGDDFLIELNGEIAPPAHTT
jgi:hypothetical protein